MSEDFTKNYKCPEVPVKVDAQYFCLMLSVYLVESYQTLLCSAHGAVKAPYSWAGCSVSQVGSVILARGLQSITLHKHSRNMLCSSSISSRHYDVVNTNNSGTGGNRKSVLALLYQQGSAHNIGTAKPARCSTDKAPLSELKTRAVLGGEARGECAERLSSTNRGVCCSWLGLASFTECIC